MKVHLAGSDSLARLFQQQGAAVSQGEPVPPDADLYLFGGGDEAMKHLDRGLVILDLRDDTDLASATWSAYADLCLVADAAARTDLIEAAGCEPERIFVAAGDAAVLDLVDRALRDDLPPATAERRGAPVPDETLSPTLSEPAALAARLDALEHQADVMQREYQVRSRLPIVGPLVAWMRRNLTSHLREPYLDPTLERQVAFNRTVVASMKDMQKHLETIEKNVKQLQGNSEP